MHKPYIEQHRCECKCRTSSEAEKNLIRKSVRRKRWFSLGNFHRFPEKMKNLNAGGCYANKRKATNPNILKKGLASRTTVEGYHTNKSCMLVFVAISSLSLSYSFRLHHFSGCFLLLFMLILRCVQKTSRSAQSNLTDFESFSSPLKTRNLDFALPLILFRVILAVV